MKKIILAACIITIGICSIIMKSNGSARRCISSNIESLTLLEDDNDDSTSDPVGGTCCATDKGVCEVGAVKLVGYYLHKEISPCP